MGRIAILSGQGRLPAILAQAVADALVVGFHGVSVDAPLQPAQMARFEQFGALFDMLRAEGIDAVVFAGGLTRPALDPSLFDATTRALAPRIAAGLAGGDDGLLRSVVQIFEQAGFAVKGAHQVMPGLTVGAELLTQTAPDAALQADATRGGAILQAIGAQDVSQACVVAGGLCLGIETAQGTQAMLDFVAGTRAALRPDPGGSLIKWAKPGQDLRIDMPAIGPDTVDQVVAAGLTGICIEAGSVLVLDRDTVLARADAAGLALWAVTR